MDWCVVAAQATASDKDLFLAFGLDAVTIHNSDVSLAAWLEARLDTALGHWPEQGGHQGLPGNPQLQPGSTAVDAAVITRAVGQGVALGYQHLVTHCVNIPASPGGDKASKAGDSTYSGDDVCAVMAFSGIEGPQDCQVIWTIFVEKKKNVEACRHYLVKGTADYAYNRRIVIDGGIYLEQDTMKSILDLRFNPGKGIAYIQSAAKGLSLLCCFSRSNNKTVEIKERELALNVMEQTHQFEDYIKYVKGTVARQLTSNSWDLKQNIATYMALLWVLFGDRCDYLINLNKIHAVIDLPEVQQLRHKFSAEICRRISWAIIDGGQTFFNTVLT